MDNFEQLSDLKNMHSLGILSDEEYQKQKQNVLNSIQKSKHVQTSQVNVKVSHSNGLNIFLWAVIGVLTVISVGIIIYVVMNQTSFQSSAKTNRVENTNKNVSNAHDDGRQLIDLNEKRFESSGDRVRFDNLFLSRVERLSKVVSDKSGLKYNVGGQAIIRRPSQYENDDTTYIVDMFDQPRSSVGPGANNGNAYVVKLEWNKELQGFDIVNGDDLPSMFKDVLKADSTDKDFNPVDEWAKTYDGTIKLDVAVGMGFSAADIRSSKVLEVVEMRPEHTNQVRLNHSYTVF